MKYIRQEWKTRNIIPLIDNEVDVLIIENTPCSQIEMFNFLTPYYEVAPQDPLDQMWVSVVSDKRSEQKDNLKGNTELEWHIDKGYAKRPFDMVLLYSVLVGQDSGDTLFVDNRITDLIPDYFKKFQDEIVKFDVNRFLHSDQYGYHFRNEIERRWFRRKYGTVNHKLFQQDKRGDYIFYCEAYNIIPDADVVKEFLYHPNRIYRHKWKTGELLLYNNKATNHKREKGGVERHLWKLALYEK
jgi:hypothetical protein